MAQLTFRAGHLGLGPTGMSLAWAVGESPAQGQSLSGDRFLVERTRSGTLLAVIDALGHGADAALVADEAVSALGSLASSELADVLTESDKRLHGTRGVVACLVWFDHVGSLSWLGVGNVSATLWRSVYGHLRLRASARTNAGIIGMQLPSLRADREELRPNDLVVVATDGIGSDFAGDFGDADAPEAIARGLITAHRLPLDDGLVVVARYVEAHGG